MIILELPKVPETEDSPVWPWLQFLKSKSMEDYKMLVKKHPELKEATICAQKVTLGGTTAYYIIRSGNEAQG